MQTALITVEYAFVSPLLFTLPFAGHVCRVRQLWKGCGGAVAGVRPVRPVLPSLLCEQQSKYFGPCLCFIFYFFLFCFVEKRELISTVSADHKDKAPQGLALLGMHRLRSVWEGVGPLPASAVRRLRRQLSHLLPGPSSAQRPKGRLEVQMVQIFHF